MALTEQDVRYVAELAHLELSEDEVKRLVPQLGSILQYMEKLNQLDTSQVEPMAQVAVALAENPSLRSDRTEQCFTNEEALANAPEQGAGSFKVPRVIERE